MPLRQLRCKAKKVKPEHKVAGLFAVHKVESNIKNVSGSVDNPSRTRFSSQSRNKSRLLMFAFKVLSRTAHRQTINANGGHANADRHALAFLAASANTTIKL